MNSTRTVSIVVGGLALALLIAVIGVIVLAIGNHPVPDLLKEIGVGALAALAGILARTNTEPDPTVKAFTETTPLSGVIESVPAEVHFHMHNSGAETPAGGVAVAETEPPIF